MADDQGTLAVSVYQSHTTPRTIQAAVSLLGCLSYERSTALKRPGVLEAGNYLLTEDFK
jgi:hypothetical protein